MRKIDDGRYLCLHQKTEGVLDVILEEMKEETLQTGDLLPGPSGGPV